MALLGVVGIAVLTGGEPLGAAFRSSVAPALGLDELSGFFLAVLALTAVPTLLFARDYLPGSAGERGVGALTAGFLLSLVGVLAARDVTTFLAFWELMTRCPARSRRSRHDCRAAAVRRRCSLTGRCAGCGQRAPWTLRERAWCTGLRRRWSPPV